MTNIEIKGIVWEVKEGKRTAISVDGVIYRIESESPETSKVSPSPYIRSPKEPYLHKWIRKNDIKEFRLEDFFKTHPKQREREDKVLKYISKLVSDDKLVQMGKNKFVVKEI